MHLNFGTSSTQSREMNSLEKAILRQNGEYFRERDRGEELIRALRRA
jgi:hypothetical protein